MPSSLKHTINDGMHSEVINTGHTRGVSMQIGVDAPKAGKMSIQHRKNKSVIANQIKLNPALNGPSHNQMRKSQDSRKGQTKNP